MFSPVLAGGCAASTCCRATPHDLTGHKLEPVKSSIVRSRFRLKALLRADAKRRCSASWDRESRAVAALRPAGYSSGRGDCARGGCSARRWGSLAGGMLVLCRACGSLGMSCVRSRLSLRFPRGVLCSLTPAVCRLCAKQDGLRDVAFLFRRGSRSPVARSRGVGAVICLGGFISGLYVSLWRSRRVTGTRGRSYEGDGAGGAALVRLCAIALAG